MTAGSGIKVSKHGNNQKNISIDFNSPEIEYIGNEVNIGDIMLEALSLEIPLYPKQKGAQFDAVTITKSGVRPLDRTTNNPYHSLRKLK